MPVEDLARVGQRRADWNGVKRLARHHVGDRTIEIRLEAEIPVRQDADEPAFLAAVLGDRNARDAVLPHQLVRFAYPVARGKRDRVHDHSALGALHPIDFRRLVLDGQILVDDPDAALLGHGDGEPGLGDRIHGRAGQRNVQ